MAASLDYATLGRTRYNVQWIKPTGDVKLTEQSLNHQFIEGVGATTVFVPANASDGMWFAFRALGGGLTVKTPKIPEVPESAEGVGDERPEVPEFTLITIDGGKSEEIVFVGGQWRGDGVAVQPPPPESAAMKKQRVLDEKRMAEAEVENERLKKEEEHLLALADMTPEERKEADKKKAEADAVKVSTVAGQQSTHLPGPTGPNHPPPIDPKSTVKK